MSWIILIIAGLFEIIWALGLKHTEGFTKLLPSIFTLSTMAVSVYLLSVAIRTLPTSTVYAVWTGIGTIGVALFGILIYKEPANLSRIICIMLIVVGIVGLKMIKA